MADSGQFGNLFFSCIASSHCTSTVVPAGNWSKKTASHAPKLRPSIGEGESQLRKGLFFDGIAREVSVLQIRHPFFDQLGDDDHAQSLVDKRRKLEGQQ